MKAASVHYWPLPLDLSIDFFLSVIVAPLLKNVYPGVFIRINKACDDKLKKWVNNIFKQNSLNVMFYCANTSYPMDSC